ncbi:unnamed protein product [Gadus morhua 'NCC']
MEVALLCFSGVLLALCPGALSLPQGIDRASPSPSPGPGILSSSRRVPYPLYMMQLYRSFQTGDPTAAPRAGGAPGTGGDRPSSQSDSVLSLMAQGCLQVGDRWTITFDMSSVTAGDPVQSAELRVRLPAFSASPRVTVDVYHSPRQSCSAGPLSRPCPRGEGLHLGSFVASPNSTLHSSWRVFDVTSLLTLWLRQGDRPGGASAGVLPPGAEDGSGAQEEEAEASGTRGGRRGQKRHPAAGRVMMVVYSTHQPPPEGSGVRSLIRAVDRSKYVGAARGQARRHKRNRMDRIRLADHEAAATAAPQEAGGGALCRRVDMMVDFEQIGWDEWIVHPKRYNAYRCEGLCPTPLDESLQPTNHAYMQSLLRLHQPERVSCPSCVATRLAPLSMLYYEDDDVVLRHHEDMMVEECGCH